METAIDGVGGEVTGGRIVVYRAEVRVRAQTVVM
jgi:hypothetical protein